MKYLRALIREILEELDKKDKKKIGTDEFAVELLTEPDISENDDTEPENEVSVVGAIAGVTGPLGKSTTYLGNKKED